MIQKAYNILDADQKAKLKKLITENEKENDEFFKRVSRYCK